MQLYTFTHLCKSFWWTYVCISVGYISISEIARSCSNFMFNFLRNCQSIFHSGYTIPHSNQQCMSVPISPYPYQLLFFFKYCYYNPPGGYKVVTHCGFDLYFPNDMTLSIFSCAFWPFVYIICRNVYSSPLLTF